MREELDNYTSLCPLKKESKTLVKTMIDQVIEICGKDNIKYFHIGADEVFNLNSC
jgi:hypothetical protein